MKSLLLSIIALVFFANVSKAQDHGAPDLKDVIKWSYTVEYASDTEATLVFRASLFHHFHLFSMKHKIEDYDFTGTPTNFKFEPSSDYTLVGKVRENSPTTGSDETGTYVWHESKAKFKQKIKINSKKAFDIKFSSEWQVCNDVMCHMPQEQSLSIKVDPTKQTAAEVKPVAPVETSIPEILTSEAVNPEIQTVIAAAGARGTCTMPEEIDEIPAKFGYRATKSPTDSSNYTMMFILQAQDGWKVPSNADGLFKPVNFSFSKSNLYNLTGELETPKADSVYYDSVYKQNIAFYPNGSVFTQKLKLTGDSIPVFYGNVELSALSDEEYLVTQNKDFLYDLSKAKFEISEGDDSKSYWTIFIIAFFSGFAALLTPCVFPMIPMTVSFFTKQSKTKAKGIQNAIVYALCIIGIYIALGLGVTYAFGADALNAMSTNVWFNIVFFLLLLVFGASFLGAFEIRMPSKWVNKADSNVDKGGFIGIFFMAFTLALVSFSCTGPIIGTLLVQAVTDGGMGPFFGMLGFSLALALPFALFAAFPGWLNSLPQSGGWLNSVKVVLGLLEIALAFKFLSNADLVVTAHLLEREVFLAIWIVIFAFIGLYLIGKLKFSHDSPLPFISTTRIFLAMLVFSFVIYMVPGMWGAPVKLLSGFLPPQNYSEIPYGIMGSAPEHELPEHAHHGPHGLTVFHDKDYGMEYAEEIGKPVMLDYTGHACINCRKMEDQVWSSEVIKKMLEDSVVVISLYVDEKHNLPKNEYFKDDNGKMITTVGGKWSYDQRVNYASQTQPLYVLIDDKGEKLMPTTSYDPNIDLFKTWLNNGIEEYDARKNMQSADGESIVKPKTCIDPKQAPAYKDFYFEIYQEEYIPTISAAKKAEH